METEENEAESKNDTNKKVTHPDGGYGWVILLAIVLINCSVMILVQCFGILFESFFSLMENKTFKASTLLHLQNSLFSTVGFFGSPMLSKHGFRKTGFVGALLMILGIFATSFAESYEALVITVAVLIGIGQGILMPATYLAISTYFNKRLTIASSISTTGASISSVFMPKICDILLSRLGRRETILVLAAISLLSLVGCFLLKPLKIEIHDDNADKLLKMETIQKQKTDEQVLDPNKVYNSTTLSNSPRNTMWNRIKTMFDLNLLKGLRFDIAVIGLSLSFASELNTIILMQFMLPNFNLNQTDVADVTTVQFSFDVIGRLVVPFVSHSVNAPPRFMYASALVVSTIARTVLSVWSESRLVIFLSCAVIGLVKGTRAVFQSVIIPKLVPLDKLASANGINFLLNGVVSLIIGSFIGVIRDKTGSFLPALHTASGISMFCVMLWTLEWMFVKSKHERIQRNNLS